MVHEMTDTDPRRLFKLATSYRLPGELSDWHMGGDLYPGQLLRRAA